MDQHGVGRGTLLIVVRGRVWADDELSLDISLDSSECSDNLSDMRAERVRHRQSETLLSSETSERMPSEWAQGCGGCTVLYQ